MVSAEWDGLPSHHSVVITVSKQGNHTCHKYQPNCKTLDDALKLVLNAYVQVNGTQSDKVLINVTYDQNITTSVQYNFSLHHNLSIVVSSWSDIPNVIKCSSANSLSVMTKGSYNLSWIWKNIEFYGCYKYNKTKKTDSWHSP